MVFDTGWDACCVGGRCPHINPGAMAPLSTAGSWGTGHMCWLAPGHVTCHPVSTLWGCQLSNVQALSQKGGGVGAANYEQSSGLAEKPAVRRPLPPQNSGRQC